MQADDGEGSEGVPAAKGVDRKGKGRAEPQVDIEEGVQKTGTGTSSSSEVNTRLIRSEQCTSQAS